MRTCSSLCADCLLVLWPRLKCRQQRRRTHSATGLWEWREGSWCRSFQVGVQVSLRKKKDRILKNIHVFFVVLLSDSVLGPLLGHIRCAARRLQRSLYIPCGDMHLVGMSRAIGETYYHRVSKYVPEVNPSSSMLHPEISLEPGWWRIADYIDLPA